MRKLLALVVITGLLVALIPASAMAGDTHAVRNRWAGAAIGVAAIAASPAVADDSGDGWNGLGPARIGRVMFHHP